METHLSLLERITRAITHSHDIAGTLQRIVSLVKEEMHTDVCSLYLYEEEKDRLVLSATEGLAPESVGKVAMKPSEGLTGLVFETAAPLVAQDAPRHPRYKYFPVTREEEFQTYLGVPLISRHRPLGVLVVQDRADRHYGPPEIQLFTTIAGQVAGVVANARLLAELTQARRNEGEKEDASPAPHLLHGIAATPGIAMGPARILETAEDLHYIVEEKSREPEKELARFEAAAAAARGQVAALRHRMVEQAGEESASIFGIHLMMLEDEGFLRKVHRLIGEGYTALFAVKTVIAGYLASFDNIDDPYLKDRVVDIEDVGRRLLRNLTGGGRETLSMGTEGILVARTITPSDTANLPEEMVKGIATSGGGQTSHAIILARSLGIPCVVGVEDLLEGVRPDDTIIVDGNTGNVFINPDREVIREYRRHMEEFQRHLSELVSEKGLPAVTRDGRRVSLLANVGLLSDLKLVQYYGAEGIGLYRTEFPFFARKTPPGEEDQYRVYRKMVEGAEGIPITIRTLDLGGDKSLPYLGVPAEENPFLGWRSIRMCLENADLFKTQLRAIFRAARHGPVRLLLPMISSVDEVVRAKTLIRETIRELESSRIPFNPRVPLGIMIEIPSAAYLAPKLAKEVEFFSIGTNDLTQYALAVDRNNKKVAHLYDPMNPAVLHLMALTAKAAHKAGIPVSVCGEIASDPLWTPLLLGLGFTELSMNPASIPVVKRVVRSIRYDEASKAAHRALRSGTASEVSRILSRFETLLAAQRPLSASQPAI